MTDELGYPLLDLRASDNTTGSESNPSHTYLSAGVYEAILTVTGHNGLTHEATVTINVNPHIAEITELVEDLITT